MYAKKLEMPNSPRIQAETKRQKIHKSFHLDGNEMYFAYDVRAKSNTTIRVGPPRWKKIDVGGYIGGYC